MDVDDAKGRPKLPKFHKLVLSSSTLHVSLGPAAQWPNGPTLFHNDDDDDDAHNNNDFSLLLSLNEIDQSATGLITPDLDRPTD